MSDINAPPKKLGRRPVPIDMKLLGQLASIQCTYDEIAAVLGIKKRGFIDRINAEPDLKRAIEIGWENGRASIRRQQYKLLEAGNATMAVWLGKNYLGQRDNLDTKVTGSGPNGELEITAGSAPERLESRMLRIAERRRTQGSV